MRGAKQQTIDFTRGDQLGLLKSLPIKSADVGDGKAAARVSSRMALSVLRAIDDYCGKSGRCWASAATIGADINCSERSVRRAIRLLESEQLIVIEHRHGRSPIMVINWGEISLRVSKANATATPDIFPSGNPGHFFANPGQSDTNPGQSDRNPGQYVRRTVSNRKRTALPPPPQNTSGSEGSDFDLPPPIEETATWHHVAQRLALSGIREWRRALADLQAAVDVKHATRLLDVYTDRVGAYGPFALYRRCRNASAVLPPEDGWPDPKPESAYARDHVAAERILAAVHRDAANRESLGYDKPSPKAIAAVAADRMAAAGLGCDLLPERYRQLLERNSRTDKERQMCS
ncbi:hypothetical protein Poly24_13790 [Rosistilla carotiformis]|uniref:Helix-turn-helix domain-containing protein n=1 Tax=Rosistilla carotiformis TaxID=2528017 RepID=A0A518JQ53_9BACT|nr:helix-turn-helix domain-containing protein [Rosistilla carotiformis]QDV67677.1 hypothetical protein Poly24_13790 [Rosistilla carotiformis]